VTPSATGKREFRTSSSCTAVAPAAPRPAADARPGTHPTRRSPVFTVAVLVAFFALLTVADLLPGQSGAPGLVAPVR
jgi:hypothetical protein